jgi:thiol:disulfide interchange protein DsbA
MGKASVAHRNANQRMILVRNAIIGFAIVMVVGVGGYGLLYSSGVGSSDTFVEGEHYVLLDNPRALRPGTPIPVVEYFSYGCIHCRNLDPVVESWLATVPDDVGFDRSPVAFSGPWGILSQGYYALQATGALEANHERVFRAIHDSGKQFVSAEMFATYVDGHGVTQEEFLEAYNSPAVRRKAAMANRRARAFEVSSVPTLVVADRYVIKVGEVGRRESLAIVDFLLDQVRTQALATPVQDSQEAG